MIDVALSVLRHDFVVRHSRVQVLAGEYVEEDRSDRVHV